MLVVFELVTQIILEKTGYASYSRSAVSAILNCFKHIKHLKQLQSIFFYKIFSVFQRKRSNKYSISHECDIDSTIIHDFCLNKLLICSLLISKVVVKFRYCCRIKGSKICSCRIRH